MPKILLILFLFQEGDIIKEERKGIREGTRGLSGARIIDISRIKSDPNQPRKSLNELAESIKKHGLLQPITVEYIDQEDYFKIINGERRRQREFKGTVVLMTI